MIVDETLHMAAQSGLDAVDHALAAGHCNFQETDAEEGFTPLQWAASAGYSDVCDQLIRKGAHPDWTDDADEWTALHHAAMGGHHETVAQLLRSKADPRIVCNNMGTALHRACEQGHVGIVRCLLDADLDVNAVDGDMDSPLHLAACGLDLKGHPEIVECLLKHGANPHLTNKPKRLASKVTKNGEIRKMLQKAEDGWEAAGKPTRRDDIVRQHQPGSRTQEDLRLQLAKKSAPIKQKESVAVDQENIDPQQRDKKRPAKKAAAKAPAPKRSKRPAATAKPKATEAPKRQAAKSATKKVHPKKSNEKQVQPSTTQRELASDDTEMIFELDASDSPVHAQSRPTNPTKNNNRSRLMIPPASAAKHLDAELQKEHRKRNEAAAKAALLNDNQVQEERRKRDEAAEKQLLLEDSKARQREAARADAARAVAESAAAAAPADRWYSNCILSQEQQLTLTREAAAKDTADNTLAESAEKHLAWENATTSEDGRLEQLSKSVFRALTEVESISLEQLRGQINAAHKDSSLLFSLADVKIAVTSHADRGTMFFDDSDKVVYSLKN